MLDFPAALANQRPCIRGSTNRSLSGLLSCPREVTLNARGTLQCHEMSQAAAAAAVAAVRGGTLAHDG